MCTSCIICCHAIQVFEIFYILRSFYTTIICTADGCFKILIILAFPHSFPLYSIFPLQFVLQSCPAVLFLPQPIAQGHLHISQCEITTFPPILKSPNLLKASLVRYLLFNLNRIGDKQHPYLMPLPVFTHLVSPWSSHILTFRSMYNLFINFLSHQSTLVSFEICINLLAPNNVYIRHTTQLTSRCCILNIYSTNILTEYFKHVAHSPFFFFLQDAVYFIMLPFLVPVIFTF